MSTTYEATDRIRATVTDRGEELADDSPFTRGRYRWGYTVTVRVDADEYESPAFGSVADYEAGIPAEDAHATMAALVIAELVDAAVDPDEFYGMATDYGEVGLKYEQARQIMRLIDFAQAHHATLTTDEALKVGEAARESDDACRAILREVG